MILPLPFKLACYKHQRVRAEFVTPGFLLHPSAVQWDAYIRGAYTNDVKIILEAVLCCKYDFYEPCKSYCQGDSWFSHCRTEPKHRDFWANMELSRFRNRLLS